MKLLRKYYNNHPDLWRRSINKMLTSDRSNPPPENAVVFAGSSSIRFWDTLEEDMKPIPVVNRGFGGSMVHQVVHYMDRIIVPLNPRAVFFYAGENDIAGIIFNRRLDAEVVADSFREFCTRLHEQSPETDIHFISIKPPKLRLKYWPEMQRANTLVEEFCMTDSRLHYVDIVPAMQRADGQTRVELFRRDGIHLNPEGYEVWTSVIRPIVVNLSSAKPG